MLTPVLTYAAQSLHRDARAQALAAQRPSYHRRRASRRRGTNRLGHLARGLFAAPPRSLPER